MKDNNIEVDYKKLSKLRNQIYFVKNILEYLFFCMFFITILYLGFYDINNFSLILISILPITFLMYKIIIFFIYKTNIGNHLKKERRNLNNSNNKEVENIIDKYIDIIIINEQYDIIPLMKGQKYSEINKKVKVIINKDEMKHFICCLDDELFRDFLYSKRFKNIYFIYRKKESIKQVYENI